MIVDAFNAVLRSAVAGYAALLGPLHPLVGLAALSVLIGVGMLWVVGKASDQGAILRAKKRMQACLLEMRLYRDEPVLLLRAQGALLASNARYLGHMLRPALVLALPMVILYGHFDAVYGRRPLAPGETALLTVSTAIPGQQFEIAADGPVLIDSVPVTAAAKREVNWRIRAVAEGDGSLTLRTQEATVAKAAVAGAAGRYVSVTRARSWWKRLLLAPGEGGFEAATIDSVRIDYPAREIGAGNWQTHWVIWFLAISLLSAYMLKGFFGIVL